MFRTGRKNAYIRRDKRSGKPDFSASCERAFFRRVDFADGRKPLQKHGLNPPKPILTLKKFLLYNHFNYTFKGCEGESSRPVSCKESRRRVQGGRGRQAKLTPEPRR